jgi:hypothetical protein
MIWQEHCWKRRCAAPFGNVLRGLGENEEGAAKVGGNDLVEGSTSLLVIATEA